MLNSYFFVPATKLEKIHHVKKMVVDEIIIDFEDAIISSERNNYFKILKTISNINDYWFRVPLRNAFNDLINIDFIKELNSIGVDKIVLPKLKSGEELLNIINSFSENKFIVLIEHPRLLIEIKDLITHNPLVLKSILGIGLGSHDLMTFLEAKHGESQLDYPRKQVLYIAKAYGLTAIDIASMNIFNEQEFIAELKYGSDNGYNGKFLIHPNQIEWLTNYIKHDTELLVWAKRVVSKLPEGFNGGSIAPFILDKQVIEKPHVLKALKIIKKNKYGK